VLMQATGTDQQLIKLMLLQQFFKAGL